MHKSKEDLFRTDGTAMGALAGARAIAIGHLLQKATYRDEAGGDRGHVKYDYNTPSQLLRTEDQATNVLENVQDPEGRVSAGKRTTLVSGFEVAAMPVLEPSFAKQFCDHYSGDLAHVIAQLCMNFVITR